LCRASTSWLHPSKKDVDGRDEPGHDGKKSGIRTISEFTKLLLTTDPNHFYIPRHPVPLRGALRNVTSAGRAAVDATARLTSVANADGEDVWS
jgi:hypothetical protein